MKKQIITSLVLGAIAMGSVSAMEMSATSSSMMKDKMMDDHMMGSTTMMKKDDTMMKDSMSDMYEKVSNISKKEDIKKVQMMLVEKGYLKMPKGVSYGYYGKLTTAAFKNYKLSMKDKMNQ
jgi:predicted transcriptional regulator